MNPRIKTSLSVDKAYGIRITQKMIDSYDSYLENHVVGVRYAWEQVQKKIYFNTSYTREIYYLLSIHDQDKYRESEYIPYLIHYYSDITNSESEAAYETAWERHYTKSPHHWRYWVFNNVPKDAQPKYILEMMLNWHSKSALYPELTAYNQYNEEKNSIVLSEKTRGIIEKYIDLFDEPVKIPSIPSEYIQFDGMAGHGFRTIIPNNNIEGDKESSSINDPRVDYAIVDKTTVEE